MVGLVARRRHAARHVDAEGRWTMGIDGEGRESVPAPCLKLNVIIVVHVTMWLRARGRHPLSATPSSSWSSPPAYRTEATTHPLIYHDTLNLGSWPQIKTTCHAFTTEHH